jgi:hypothetical protein
MKVKQRTLHMYMINDNIILHIAISDMAALLYLCVCLASQYNWPILSLLPMFHHGQQMQLQHGIQSIIFLIHQCHLTMVLLS